MAYLTIELKTNNEGGTAADVLYSGVDERVAEQKYHQALATAATSGRPLHAAIIIDSTGLLIESKCFASGVGLGE